MSESNPYVAMEQHVGRAVLRELSDRGGFDGWWDDIEADIQDEITRAVGRAAMGAVIHP